MWSLELNNDIKTTDEATESEEDTDDIDLITSPIIKCKWFALSTTSVRSETAGTEPLLGNPIPGT